MSTTPGTYAVLPTVFHDDGTLDLHGQAAVVSAYGDAGVQGLAALGVMGEAGELTAEEQVAVLRTVRRAAAGLHLTVGLGPPGPQQPAAARRAMDAGADALLAGIPADEPEEALGRIGALGLPLIVQHHPAATGVRVTHEEVVRLLVALRPAAAKLEAPPTPDLVAAVVAAGGPPVLGGLSGLFLLEELEAGSAGAMTGLAVPELLVEVVATALGGDLGRARERYLHLATYLRLEAGPGTTGLVVRKEAWRQRGVIGSSRVRSGPPLAAATKQAITRRLRDCGIALPAPFPGA